jgi:hypothetical protein
MSARAQSGGSQRPIGKPAGVGIYFQESGSDIVVNHLIRGGSAERSGKVQAGDIIISIDDKDVRNKGVGEMRNFIVGPEGSTVTLGFMRDGGSFTVALLRGSPEYITTGTCCACVHVYVCVGVWLGVWLGVWCVFDINCINAGIHHTSNGTRSVDVEIAHGSECALTPHDGIYA